MRRLLICLFMLAFLGLPSWLALASDTCGICFTEPGESHLGCDEHLCCRSCAASAASHDLLYFGRSTVGCYVRECPADSLSNDAVEALIGPEEMARVASAQAKRNEPITRVCSNRACDGGKLALGPLHRPTNNRLELECGNCKTLTCLFCGESVPQPELKRGIFYRRLVHAQHHCNEYQASELRQQLKMEDPKKGVKPCPACFVLIHRSDGCYRMKCKCGVAFCWDCLEFGHHEVDSCEGNVAEDSFDLFAGLVEISAGIQGAIRHAGTFPVKLKHSLARMVKCKRERLARHVSREAQEEDSEEAIMVRMVDRDEMAH